MNTSFLTDKSAKQNELATVQNDLSSLKENELNSKFINEQKEKIINHFKDFKELNYDIVNSFIDYIEIGEKKQIAKMLYFIGIFRQNYSNFRHFMV